MFVPSSAGTFGSNERRIRAWWGSDKIKFIEADMDIKKAYTKRHNKQSDPCTNDIQNQDTAACVSQFIHKEIGCRPKIQGNDGRNQTEGPLCQSASQLRAFANISGILQYGTAASIYSVTGCLSACEKSRFDLRVNQIVEKPVRPNMKQNLIRLRLSVTDTSYAKEEEYIIYDSNSFIADFGGYMGLLLGSSILSLFDALEDLSRTARNKFKRIMK